MLLLSPKNIHFIYIITFLDSLLKGLQEFSTFKQIIFLEIGLKCIISDYNQGHIIWELHTRAHILLIVNSLVQDPTVRCAKNSTFKVFFSLKWT